jgi:hypothetical protein
MTRRTLFELAFPCVVPAAAVAQPKSDPNDNGLPGAMTEPELRREPVKYELDVPFVDDDNPPHGLDV